jgi:hypothetical protein
MEVCGRCAFLRAVCAFADRFSPPFLMADSTQPAANWADMAASLLSKLSGGVELACTFEQMELQMPNPQNPAASTTWRLNGSLRIRTKGGNPPSGGALPPATNSPGLGG